MVQKRVPENGGQRVATDTQKLDFVVCYRAPEITFRAKFSGFNALFFIGIRSKLAELGLKQDFTKSCIFSADLKNFLDEKFQFFGNALKTLFLDRFQKFQMFLNKLGS